jgi:ribonucleoside-diphosphate reductase alpha chain
MKVKYQGIEIHEEDPSYITEYSRTLVDGFYKREDETISQALARPAIAFCYGDYELAQRIYDYAYNGWFMYAGRVLSNSLKGKWWKKEPEDVTDWRTSYFVPEEKFYGQPINCFAFNVPDTAVGQVSVIQELADLCMLGGGTAAHMSIRGIGGKAVGPIPYMKMMDSAIAYFQQGKSKRAALAAYLDVDHPDIIEHIRFRKPGGDSKRRSDNRKQFHCAVNLTDEFIDAVLNDKEYDLKCPHTKRVYETLKARKVWEEILETRALTGEPFLMKKDAANRNLPEAQKKLGLSIKGSNLCTEILLPTDEDRTFVCCLSSLNLEKFDEWKDTTIVQDLVRFLDNVLQSFIDHAPDSIKRAKYSAEKERAIGLGAMGFHGYLQSKGIPFESGGFNSATQHNNILFKHIVAKGVEGSRQLAIERGEPDDMKGTGLRNSRLFALAPNANNADLLDTSPSIEPYFRNIFVKSTKAGNPTVKNRHLERVLEKYGKNTEEVWKSIDDNDGKVDHLDFLSDHEKQVYKVTMEMDQHWLVELAQQRGQIMGVYGQAQSLNTYFPFGSSRKYVMSVHMKFLKSPDVYTMYYLRTEREGDADHAKAIERKALVDWTDTEECLGCHG